MRQELSLLQLTQSRSLSSRVLIKTICSYSNPTIYLNFNLAGQPGD